MEKMVYNLDADSYPDQSQEVVENETETEEGNELEEQEEEEPEEESEDQEEEQGNDSEEESEEDESEEEEGSEQEEKEEDDEQEDANDDSLSPDQYIEQRFGEKYDLKTESELEELINNAIEFQKDYDSIVKERDQLKTEVGQPKFADPMQKSAFEFVSKFDTRMQGEALQTFAKLIGMDLENADPKMILEEKFIHENPQWTRAEAQRMFEKEYRKKYDLNREKFDGSDAEFEQEKQDLEIMRKGDIARAKTFLKDLREKHKPAEKEEAPKVSESVSNAIEKNSKDYSAYVSKLSEISFEDGDSEYVFKLDANKQKLVNEAVMAWVKNPASYNDKGSLNGISSPDDLISMTVGGLFMKDIVKSLKSQIKNEVNSKRVEEIAKNKPNKKKNVGNGDASRVSDDLDAQALNIIKKRKK